MADRQKGSKTIWQEPIHRRVQTGCDIRPWGHECYFHEFHGYGSIRLFRCDRGTVIYRRFWSGIVGLTYNKNSSGPEFPLISCKVTSLIMHNVTKHWNRFYMQFFSEICIFNCIVFFKKTFCLRNEKDGYNSKRFKEMSFWYGVTGVSVLGLALAISSAQILEADKSGIDDLFHTQSSVMESVDGNGLYTAFTPNEKCL